MVLYNEPREGISSCHHLMHGTSSTDIQLLRLLEIRARHPKSVPPVAPQLPEILDRPVAEDLARQNVPALTDLPSD